jgi:hypothetical protein
VGDLCGAIINIDSISPPPLLSFSPSNYIFLRLSQRFVYDLTIFYTIRKFNTNKIFNLFYIHILT